jgi:hypothetical protein
MKFGGPVPPMPNNGAIDYAALYDPKPIYDASPNQQFDGLLGENGMLSPERMRAYHDMQQMIGDPGSIASVAQQVGGMDALYEMYLRKLNNEG